MFESRTAEQRAGPRRAAVLLIALLPTLLFLGHPLQPALQSLPSAIVSAHSHHGSDREHVQHCHESLSSCSSQPVPTGPGRLLAGAPALVVPALILLRASAAEEPAPDDVAISEPVPPPRRAV